MPEIETPRSEGPESATDLLVVGLGPAGLACCLQARRDGLSVIGVGDEPAGGLVRAARRLDNLPGKTGVSGTALAADLQRQVDACGLTVLQVRVVSVTFSEQVFSTMLADGQTLYSHAVCLATGTTPSPWSPSAGMKGIHRDARSLPERLTGQRVVVIGGGEAALDTALNAKDRGADVSVLARGSTFRSAPGLLDEAYKESISLRTKTEITAVRGDTGDRQLVDDKGSTIRCHELVVCIGREPRDELVTQLCPGGWNANRTQPDRPGLCLAGDLIHGRDRYVATAMGDGQQAALAAGRWLKQKNSLEGARACQS